MNMLQTRIENPNLYYVGPINYRTKLSEYFCTEYFDVEVFLPYPEEDLAKEIERRVSKKEKYLKKNPEREYPFHNLAVEIFNFKINPEILTQIFRADDQTDSI